MAVDETGIGNYEDKVLKKKGKARVIWNNLKGKKSRGIIGEDAENNLVLRREADGGRRRGDARSRIRSSRRCATACSR